MMTERIALTLARRLIAEESRSSDAVNSGGWPAFRVCEKLRRPLSTLAGAAGFRSLLARALTLAKGESSWLQEVKINPDGSFDYTTELLAEFETEKAVRGGVAIVTQLLGLLITFIGEALTLRLVHDVWPNAALSNLKSGGDKP
jgi:hypothetical protein